MSLIPTPEQKEMEKLLPKLIDPRTEITFAELLEKVYSAPPIGSKIRVTDRGNQVFIYTENGYVPEIIWANCADEMPPDDDMTVITKDMATGLLSTCAGHHLQYWKRDEETAWTPYTPEKWKELNK